MSNLLPASITPIHYDKLPDYVFENAESILDVGCMSGLNALLSRHRQHFLAAEQRGDYLGLDIQQQEKQYLQPIVCDDILTTNISKQFDVVLCLHVIEHIPFEKWPQLFMILCDRVALCGYLVIRCPHDDPPELNYGHQHLVFHIQPDMLRTFLPGARIFKQRRRYEHFRNEGESLIWAMGRFIWRILTRHYYRYRLLGNYEVVAIWKKED